MERVSFDPADILHLEELYDASLRQTDTEVGRFLNYLSELGRSQDTVVVVTSDHGEEFHEHGRVDHFLTMYQESLRVPLLARGPGIPSGLRFSEPVSLIDLPATLLTLGGVAVPAGLDGVDLSRLWREPGSLDLSRRVLYGEASGGLEYHRWFPGFYPIYRSARRGDFKLVERTDRGEISYRLYDLATDPEETRDVSGQNPLLLAELTALLEQRPRGDAGPAPKTAVKISSQEAEQLRALGYVP
jgi:arylsulfatase A-like enzyme